MDENNNYIVRGGGVDPEPDPGNDYIGLKRNYDSSDQLLSSIAYTSGLTFPNEVSDTFGFNWTRTGLTITSWNTQRDGSGTSYAVGATIPSASTFWAIWTAIADITISYNNNTIVEFSNSDTKILETEGTYLIDDITVEYTKPSLQAKTNITPGTSSQTISPDNGYYGLSSVQINAMPSGTAGTPIATKGTVSNNSITVTPSVTNVTGYITGGTKTGTAVTVTASELVSGTKTITASGTTDVTNYANASVAAGTAGTPTASKGTVSNNSVSVTPSVTNTTGYITGGTKTGTAVTVSASELVSGTKSITSSGTTDVTNYASASVAAGSAFTPATTITVTPEVSVNSNGVITATVSATSSITPTVSAGYVTSGTTGNVGVSGSKTIYLTGQPAQTITPTTTNQTIASGKFLTGTQTILGDANLISANIKSGVSIFGVAGSHASGTDVSDTTATASDVLTGKYFYTAAGVKTQGSIPIYTGANTPG